MAVRQRTTGFTLLELLAVVALLGLVLFFVIPNLDNLTPTARLKSAARRIGSTMELAQGEAIASGQEFTMAYDLSKGTYWIILPPPTPPGGAGAPGAPGTMPTSPSPTMPGATPTTGPNGEALPPLPDVEHDPPPLVAAPAGTTGTMTPGAAGTTAPRPATPMANDPSNMQNREVVADDYVGDDVQIVSVMMPNGQEVTGGVAYVNFSSLGNEGSHSVLVQLRSPNGGQSAGQMGIRFNALTRTVDFAEQKLGFNGP